MTFEEKQKIKEVLRTLNINPDINFPYYLNKINNTAVKVEEIESMLNTIIYNQSRIERKLDILLNKLK